MRCKKVMERLDDHVDGLLAAPEAEAIRDHLDDCTECRETSLALKAASASLATWRDTDPPAACFDKILDRIAALPADAFVRPAPRGLSSLMPRFESVRSARIRWFTTSGLAAAAAVLAAVLISRNEPRSTIRRFRAEPATNVYPQPASWGSGYYFDNGLFYGGAGRPALQPVRANSRIDLLEASPR